MERSGIHRSSTSMLDSADGRTVDVTGAGTNTAGNEVDTEGAGGRADAVQVERQGEGDSRRQAVR
jgi:hypothetical protein